MSEPNRGMRLRVWRWRNDSRDGRGVVKFDGQIRPSREGGGEGGGESGVLIKMNREWMVV